MNTKYRNKISINSKTLSVISTGILTAFCSTLVHADMVDGQSWLVAQQNINKSTVANKLQTQQEVAHTLSLLQTQVTTKDLVPLVETETSSEGLVRIALLAHSQDEVLHPVWQKLINNQNSDGGFGHIEGWQSNPLDTAFVLIALSETHYLDQLDVNSRQKWQSRIHQALSYLATQQHNDGAYRISHLDDLYTSSYVLSAFTPYLQHQGQYIPIVQKLVTYIESQKTAEATWSKQTNNKGLFIDALVAESLYPYQDSHEVETFRSNFNNRVLALQNSDGSWQGDAYVTSLVLKSVNRISRPTVNPIVSAISLTVQDSETGALLGDVKVVLSSDLTTISTSTNGSGQLLKTDLLPGDYTVSIIKPGYISLNLSVKLKVGERSNVGVIKLSRSDKKDTSFIQGVVTKYLEGTPVEGATIRLYYIVSSK